MEKKLFTVKEVSRASGLSRMTILRLEERGLLTPAVVRNTRRYYDTGNVSRIMCIKAFSDMGLTYDDIALYYHSGGGSPELLERMEARFLALKRAYEEIKLRLEKKEQTVFEFVTLPQSVCYCKTYPANGFDSLYRGLYETHQETVEKGYRLCAAQPMFIINDRPESLGDFEHSDGEAIFCVPLEPQDPPEEAVVFPPCRGFSCLSYGDGENRRRDKLRFAQKVRELGLKPIGPVRAVCLVAAYTGQDIEEANYLVRYVLPIEDEQG